MKALSKDSFEKGNRSAIRLIKSGWADQTANLKYVPQLTQLTSIKDEKIYLSIYRTLHKTKIQTIYLQLFLE